MFDAHEQGEMFGRTNPMFSGASGPDEGTPKETPSEDSANDAPPISESQDTLGMLDRVQSEVSRLRELAENQATRSEELEKLRAEIDRSRAEIAQRENAAGERERQLDEAESGLIETRSTIREEADTLAKERADASETSEEQRRNASAVEERVVEVARRLEALDASEQEQRLRDEDLSTKESAFVDREQALRSEIECERATLDQRKSSLEADREAESKIREHAEKLGVELARTRERLAEAGRHLSDMKSTGDSRDEFTAGRREKLKRYKSLLRKEAEKLVRVKEGLKRKQQELKRAQDAIAQRQKKTEERERDARLAADATVQEARTVRAEADRTMRAATARASKGKASVLVFGLTGSLLVAGVGSWLAVDQFVPATYQASTRVEIDRRDVDPSAEQVESWQAFVAELPDNPHFLEQASQRLRARGYTEMRTATDLRNTINERFEIDSEGAGEMTLALRGVGEGRTRRALETFTTALVAYANETRSARFDQSSTRVIERANTGGDPVEDPRLAAFGMAYGAAAAIILILTVLCWRSLRAGATRSLRSSEPSDDTEGLLKIG